MEEAPPRTLEEGLRRAVEPFFKQMALTNPPNVNHLYATRCCNRLYVGFMLPKGCRTCTKIPSPYMFQTREELPDVLKHLEAQP